MTLKNTITVVLLLAAAFASSVDAATIIHYSAANATGGGPVAPSYQAHTVGSSTGFSPAAGSNLEREDGKLAFSGWGSRMNPTDYVGFSISSGSGYPLMLNEVSFSVRVDQAGSGRSVGGITSYTLGYRIDYADNGIEDDDWVFFQLLDASDPHSPRGEQAIWDFEDLVTFHTVEFGFFASSGNPAAKIEIENISVSGHSVPEPSSATLIAALAAGMVAGRRRRS